LPRAAVPPAESRQGKRPYTPRDLGSRPDFSPHAVGEACIKLNPWHVTRNPVMFVVEVGSVVTTIEFLGHPPAPVGSIALRP
jgi:potassium-transporting ATPase ATP-binding subunit